MNDILFLKKFYKRKILLGVMSLLVLVLFSIFGEYLLDYFKNASPSGTITHSKDMTAILGAIICIPFVFIPRVIDLVKIMLDVVFRKQKTKKVIGIKKPKAPWDMREDYVVFYAKDSWKQLYRFIVFKDVYPLNGKKIGNSYEVTYYAFTKVVTNIKKCKKDWD